MTRTDGKAEGQHPIIVAIAPDGRLVIRWFALREAIIAALNATEIDDVAYVDTPDVMVEMSVHDDAAAARAAMEATAEQLRLAMVLPGGRA